MHASVSLFASMNAVFFILSVCTCVYYVRITIFPMNFSFSLVSSYFFFHLLSGQQFQFASAPTMRLYMCVLVRLSGKSNNTWKPIHFLLLITPRQLAIFHTSVKNTAGLVRLPTLTWKQRRTMELKYCMETSLGYLL